MSCNGCRVLRKGCSDDCMLRHCLVWIENPQAQANATVFVAKFFGRATLMSFLSSVPAHQRSALFQSLLYEAVGRTINPVNGAVGLLWTGKWQLCQLGVEKVLTGGVLLNPLPHDHFLGLELDDHHTQASSTHHHHHQHQLMIDNYEEEEAKKQRAATPSEESEESSSTLGSGSRGGQTEERNKLLTLFF